MTTKPTKQIHALPVHENGQKVVRPVSIEHLRFDPDNPRLPSYIDGNSEKAVLQWMLGDATILELMTAIGERGYFEGEPLLVVDDTKKKDEYIVVEGNRRLAAAKLLNKPSLAPIKPIAVKNVYDNARNHPIELPTIKFDEKDEIWFYLGYRHVIGVKEWGPIAKARYLRELEKMAGGPRSKKKFQELARAIGSHWDYVARLLTGLVIYERMEGENFFDIDELNEATIDFAVLTTALSYENVPTFLGLENATDPEVKGLKIDNLKKLARWMFEKDSNDQTRLGESRNLKFLDDILASPEALKAFEGGYSVHQAYRMTKGPKETFQKAILDAMKSLEVARDQLHLVSDPERSDANVLEAILKLVAHLQEWITKKLSS